MKKLLRMERILTAETKSFSFVLLILLVSGIGLVSLFSSSYYFSLATSGNPYRMVIRQTMWFVLGLLLFLGVSFLPKNLIRKYVPHFLVFSLFLNLLTYLPLIGRSAGGAQRWIGITLGSLDLTFQPSELLKVSLVLYLARMIEKNRERMDNFSHAVLPPVIVVTLMVGVVFFQNDFSTAMYLFFLSFMLLFVAGIRGVHLGIIILFFMILAVFMVAFEPYRMERIMAWFAPEKDPLDTGYQILRARSAIRSGGLWGQGWGTSIAKRGTLPQSYSDFLAAVWAEEFGFTGILFVMTLFGLVLFKGIQTFFVSNDLFRRFTVLGLTLAVFFQAMINIGVAAGLFPATGIPLPLFSSGGSAVLITFLAFGLIVALERGSEEKKVKRVEVK